MDQYDDLLVRPEINITYYLLSVIFNFILDKCNLA